jgi:hypothetical protein
MEQAESSESEEEESDDEEEEYTPKKRKTVQRKTPKKGEGKKGKQVGKLEVLKTLPVEILIEVRIISPFSLLFLISSSPIDLLTPRPERPSLPFLRQQSLPQPPPRSRFLVPLENLSRASWASRCECWRVHGVAVRGPYVRKDLFGPSLFFPPFHLCFARSADETVEQRCGSKTRFADFFTRQLVCTYCRRES